VAPIRHGTRPGGRLAAKWLEPEAVSAKQHRRQLERRWKKSGSDQDRVAYRASCRRAHLLINLSRNKRRVWGAVKDLLHTSNQDARTTRVDIYTFCSLLAEFFVNKVQNIKSAISSTMSGPQFDPLESDQPFCGTLMSEFQPVTTTEVDDWSDQCLLSRLHLTPFRHHSSSKSAALIPASQSVVWAYHFPNQFQNCPSYSITQEAWLGRNRSS